FQNSLNAARTMMGLEAPISGPCHSAELNSERTPAPATSAIPSESMDQSNLQIQSKKTNLSCWFDGENAVRRMSPEVTLLARRRGSEHKAFRDLKGVACRNPEVVGDDPEKTGAGERRIGRNAHN